MSDTRRSRDPDIPDMDSHPMPVRCYHQVLRVRELRRATRARALFSYGGSSTAPEISSDMNSCPRTTESSVPILTPRPVASYADRNATPVWFKNTPATNFAQHSFPPPLYVTLWFQLASSLPLRSCHSRRQLARSRTKCWISLSPTHPQIIEMSSPTIFSVFPGNSTS